MGDAPQNRIEVMVACLEVLADGIPRMAKEICWELSRANGCWYLNKSLINSVLHREGAMLVRYDRHNYTYQLS